jgi:hypothetical protein
LGLHWIRCPRSAIVDPTTTLPNGETSKALGASNIVLLCLRYAGRLSSAPPLLEAILRPLRASWGPFGDLLGRFCLRYACRLSSAPPLLEGILKALKASWGPFRSLFGLLLGLPGGLLGPSRAVLGASWAVLGPSETRLGASWAVLGRLGPLLGPSWVPLGPSWAPPGPSWGRPGASWDRLGALLARLGALLGSSSAVLERSGRLLGPSWSVGKPKRRGGRKHRKHTTEIDDFCRSGPSWEASWEASSGVLDASWAVWGESRASWAHL